MHVRKTLQVCLETVLAVCSCCKLRIEHCWTGCIIDPHFKADHFQALCCLSAEDCSTLTIMLAIECLA